MCTRNLGRPCQFLVVFHVLIKTKLHCGLTHIAKIIITSEFKTENIPQFKKFWSDWAVFCLKVSQLGASLKVNHTHKMYKKVCLWLYEQFLLAQRTIPDIALLESTPEYWEDS